MKIPRFYPWVLLAVSGLTVLTGCYKPGPGANPFQVSRDDLIGSESRLPHDGDIFVPDESILWTLPDTTPTPNPPIKLPTPRADTVEYTVQQGDTLRKIANAYQVSVAQLIRVNQITTPDLIEVGQVFQIPPPTFELAAPDFKILPDSALINSPTNAAFDLTGFVAQKGGYLATYSEEVDGVELSGAAIVARVALEYSVNPQILLALLEYQSEWVTDANPSEETNDFPLRYYDYQRNGLYPQLSWAANLLNEGYYLWKINAINVWTLSDSTVVKVNPTINPGTAGVLNLLRYLTDYSNWDLAVSENGLFKTFFNFFGYPFHTALEPLIPQDLIQPSLRLPFEAGDVWSFTGGPHGGWGTGSAWAAIDFAPPGEALGCFPSDIWVTASAPGKVVYSDHGAVIQDLDGDGIWQTGWSLLYMHMDSRERVEVGQYLEAGDRIGHPSCEGGFSTGTHLHFARRYNGEWIAADADLPLVLDGWQSVGYGVEYDGYLIKGDRSVEAWNGRSEFNAIQR